MTPRISLKSSNRVNVTGSRGSAGWEVFASGSELESVITLPFGYCKDTINLLVDEGLRLLEDITSKMGEVALRVVAYTSSDLEKESLLGFNSKLNERGYTMSPVKTGRSIYNLERKPAARLQ